MEVELGKLFRLQEFDQLLNGHECCSHDVFVFLSRTFPNGFDHLVAEGVLFVTGAQVDQLQRALDQLAVRVLYVDVLKDLSLDNPAREVLEVEEPHGSDVVLSELVIGKSLTIFDLIKDILKLSHASNFLLEERAH